MVKVFGYDLEEKGNSVVVNKNNIEKLRFIHSKGKLIFFDKGKKYGEIDINGNCVFDISEEAKNNFLPKVNSKDVYKLDSNVFVSHIGLLRETLIKLFVQAQLGEIENSDIPNKVFEYLNSDKYKNQVQQIAGVLKAHSDRIQDRMKTFARYVKQDKKLLYDIVPLLIKTFKGDINKIASEEVLSLPELDSLEGDLQK